MRGCVLLLLVLTFAAHADGVSLTIGQAEAALEGPWRFQPGDNPRWATPEFDDSEWATLDLRPAPGAHDADVGLSNYVRGWWAQGFAGHAGYAWYRLRVHIDAPPDTRLALLAPAYVEDAYQVFWNGDLIGSAGDFSGATPSARSTKPRMFELPRTTGAGADAVIAIRVWMQPGSDREADAGGIHIAPRIGEWKAVHDHYRLQWLETFRGYVVDVVEPFVFVLLAGFSWLSRRRQASVTFAFWLGTALLLTALLRVNQAVYFWFDVESQNTFAVVKSVLLEPLGLAAWILAWLHWFRLARSRFLPWLLSGAIVMTMIVVLADTAPWLRTLLRVVAAVSLITIAIVGCREPRPDRWLAVTCLILVSIGQFAEELWAIGVPGIWFPFSTGVSRTQFAYAALIVSLSALTFRSVLRADSQDASSGQ